MITHFGQFGTNDFIEYWTAFRLFISHQNPYDPQLMLDLQQQLGRHTNTPLMMWNPPWLLVIMAPVLMLGFPEAAFAWIICNLIFLSVTVYFCLDLIGFSSLSSSHIFLSILLTLSFFPLYSALAVGQLGLLLSLSLIGAIWSITKKKICLSALFLALWTLKVHLFLPMATLLLIKSLFNRELWLNFLGATLMIICLLFLSELIHPNVTHSWWSAFSTTQSGAMLTPVTLWRTATLTGGVRIMLAENNIAPLWPMWVVPAMGISVVSILTITLNKRLSYLEGAIFSALISLIFGPFGWLFDYSVLFPGYLITTITPLVDPYRFNHARWPSRLAISTQGVMWILAPFLSAHEYWLWFPPLLMMISFPILRQMATNGMD